MTNFEKDVLQELLLMFAREIEEKGNEALAFDLPDVRREEVKKQALNLRLLIR